jgi:uncharacterized protein YycO
VSLIAQYRGTSFISRAIRLQTRSEYSHTAILLNDGSVYESWYGVGVAHSGSLSELHSPGTVVDLFEVVPDVDWVAAKVFIMARLGEDYDLPAVIRFVTRFRSKPNNKWFCSELVAAALSAGGVDLQHLPPSMLSPRDIGMSPLLRKVDEVVTS